jgi:hypothetical protein
LNNKKASLTISNERGFFCNFNSLPLTKEKLLKIELVGDDKICICIKIIEVLEMKSKIIFENTNKNAVQKSNKEFENLIKKSIYIALLEKGMINQKQYEKCLEKIKD